MGHRILLAVCIVYLATANMIWIAVDTRPPFWDMAAHRTSAIRVYDAFAADGVRAIGRIPLLTGFYPPLYPSVVAGFYSMFGRTIDAAQWANLPAILLLMAATYGIGRTLMSPLAAAAAAFIVSFSPFLLWLSRETLIDYWLTSLVAAAMLLLLSTRSFSDMQNSILFGIACGLGMLTKWTFPVFLALPFIWFARKNWRAAAVSAGVAAALAAYWYLPAFARLARLLEINNAGAANEGDPSRFSWQAVVFYVRALEGYQLFLPVFLVFIAGLVLLAKDFDRRWIPVLLWVAGGWAGLMLFQNKDPRYSAPLLPAVALIAARVVDYRPVLIFFLAPVLMFQHHLTSFGIPLMPEKVVLASGVQGPLSWDWNLYTQNYFGLWGPPAQENWQIEHVLSRITEPGRIVRLGIVPDIPRFDSQAFEFYVSAAQSPVVVQRVISADPAIADQDFLLLAANERQAAGSFAPNAGEVNQFVTSRPDAFKMIDEFELPSGDVIRLYKVGSL